VCKSKEGRTLKVPRDSHVMVSDVPLRTMWRSTHVPAHIPGRCSQVIPSALARLGKRLPSVAEPPQLPPAMPAAQPLAANDGGVRPEQVGPYPLRTCVLT
jgi:hypothetical protein